MTAAGHLPGVREAGGPRGDYQALVRFANTGDDQRTAVTDRLRDALSAAPTSEATALDLQQLVLGIAVFFQVRVADSFSE